MVEVDNRGPATKLRVYEKNGLGGCHYAVGQTLHTEGGNIVSPYGGWTEHLIPYISFTESVLMGGASSVGLRPNCKVVKKVPSGAAIKVGGKKKGGGP